MMNFPPELNQAVKAHPHRLVFATISGAHLYGFPSPDSDFDLRGVHVLPITSMMGFDYPDETITITQMEGGIELDLVTHDVKKFFLLMLKRNGYVLEQLYSPLVVHTTDEHQELKELGKQCITRHHAHHYLGFAENQWKLFQKEQPPRIKPLLYVYRVLLTGIRLMQTGVIEANLQILNEHFKLPYLDELIEFKVNSAEKQVLTESDFQFHEREYLRLLGALEDAEKNSSLAETSQPSAKQGLNELLKRIRAKTIPPAS